MNPYKCAVWCDLWIGGYIGPFFFKTDASRNVAVHDARYHSMISNFLLFVMFLGIRRYKPHSTRICGTYV